VKLHIHSYRFAEEILQHEKHRSIWDEITRICREAPLFIWPNKSKKNKKLDVVQQLMNAYFDRRFAIESGWEHHPLATRISESGLRADFRKEFPDISVQVEVQLGNMARWYSDIFKFQTAYSQDLAQIAISIVPTGSITLPILLVGLEPDEDTQVVDVSRSLFAEIGEITGRNNADNLWRVVNGWISGQPIEKIGPDSEIGPRVELTAEDAEEGG
jgi:hypothetical protein